VDQSAAHALEIVNRNGAIPVGVDNACDSAHGFY
jgi:hypothetical protein